MYPAIEVMGCLPWWRKMNVVFPWPMQHGTISMITACSWKVFHSSACYSMSSNHLCRTTLSAKVSNFRPTQLASQKNLKQCTKLSDNLPSTTKFAGDGTPVFMFQIRSSQLAGTIQPTWQDPQQEHGLHRTPITDKQNWDITNMTLNEKSNSQIPIWNNMEKPQYI